MMESVSELIGRIGGKPDIKRKHKRQLDENSIGAPVEEFAQHFKRLEEKATPEAIEAKASEERAAAKSAAARAARPRLRDKRVTIRHEQEVHDLGVAIAIASGEKSFADGVHIAIKDYAERNGIVLPEGGDDA